jgi:4-amino-4-deoxy-L-arabinose transferase-like glycosyltransferase
MRPLPGSAFPALVLAVTLAGVIAWLCWSPLGANDLVGGDEGYYGIMARNISADPHYLVSPSLSPLGVPGDKPPLYPALLALSIRTLGASEVALRWISILAAAVVAVCCALLVKRAAGPAAGLLAAALLMTLPWFADGSRVVGAELPLTALGAGALALVSERPTRRRAFLAGLLLGLAFLCKLWLVVLIAIPVASLVASARDDRMRRLLALALGALLIAPLQLVAVALFSPSDLPHWLSIYFQSALAARMAGAGYSSYWIKPPIYYWGVLSHALLLLIPFVAQGVSAAWRRRREPVPWALLIWALGILILSCFRVKTGGYAYVVLPAWVSLAALGLSDLADGRRLGVPGFVFGIGLTLPWILERLGGPSLPFGLWLGTWLLFAGAQGVLRRRPRWSRATAAALAALVIAAAIVRDAQRLPLRYHEVGYRSMTSALAPHLAGAPPDRVCFVGPEVPALGFYLFRTGLYWSTPGLAWTAARGAGFEADTSIHVFIVDSGQSLYGGWPDSAMVRRLESSTREITAEVRSRMTHPTPLRVFVR